MSYISYPEVYFFCLGATLYDSIRMMYDEQLYATLKNTLLLVNEKHEKKLKSLLKKEYKTIRFGDRVLQK